MKKLILMTFVCFLGIQMSFGQDIISVKEFLKIKKDPNVVLVSARKPADYKKVHIAGAININHKDLYKASPKSTLKTVAEIAKILGEKGLSNTNTIVLYDNGSGKYSGRMYWILKYLGAKDVKLLDGHMKAWRMARKPVTKNPAKRKATTFAVKLNKGIIASIAQVKKASNSAASVIVDVRAADEFKGIKESKLPKGHIPSAINLEFKKVLTTKGKLKSKEDLQALFNAAGITKDKEIILYCESSVRAGVVYLALTSALAYPNVKVYDGALFEWTASEIVQK
ncbi:sulfurtransferase [Ancylomarina sp. DW003]|uniref:Sulfurtransferase n=1 Tax=Paralabilibaculum antarcticum TaxID=2912572 RepID=A0ABT5VNV8_9BACT|nr:MULTISPECIES: sulfurtransferase [Marinifilaceae]MDE5416442.1 sulfurtransferase [Labilibaculum sp. DW002]MDE5422766.1 sulfurtransferase [Ancylomarina sp. DW003]